MAVPILTIGYGARTAEQFLEVLEQNGVAYLIDVRSRPYSRFKPEFSKQALENLLQSRGIRYVFMGDSLGGQPADEDCYDSRGKVDYKRLGQKAFYLAGIDRLRQAWEQQLPVMIMCSEGKPEMCHRSKLIGRSLVGEGIEVVHVDENDQTLSQEAVMIREMGGQPSLFGPDFRPVTSRKSYKGQAEDGEDMSREDDP